MARWMILSSLSVCLLVTAAGARADEAVAPEPLAERMDAERARIGTMDDAALEATVAEATRTVLAPGQRDAQLILALACLRWVPPLHARSKEKLALRLVDTVLDACDRNVISARWCSELRSKAAVELVRLGREKRAEKVIRVIVPQRGLSRITYSKEWAYRGIARLHVENGEPDRAWAALERERGQGRGKRPYNRQIVEEILGAYGARGRVKQALKRIQGLPKADRLQALSAVLAGCLRADRLKEATVMVGQLPAGPARISALESIAYQAHQAGNGALAGRMLDRAYAETKGIRQRAQRAWEICYLARKAGQLEAGDRARTWAREAAKRIAGLPCEPELARGLAPVLAWAGECKEANRLLRRAGQLRFSSLDAWMKEVLDACLANKDADALGEFVAAGLPEAREPMTAYVETWLAEHPDALPEGFLDALKARVSAPQDPPGKPTGAEPDCETSSFGRHFP